jgi:hypothetical protein
LFRVFLLTRRRPRRRPWWAADRGGRVRRGGSG